MSSLMCKKGLEISVIHIVATISEPHCKRSRAESDGKHMDSSKGKGYKTRKRKSGGAERDHISDKTESRPTLSSEGCWRRRRCPKLNKNRVDEILGSRGIFFNLVSRKKKKKKKKKGDAQREAVPALQKTSMPKDTQGIPSAARIERLSQQPPQRGRWRRHGCRNQRNGFERHSELVGRWWSRTALLRSPSSQCNLPSPNEQLVPVIQHRTVSSFQEQSTPCSLPSRLENHVVKKKKKKKKKSRSK
ncbi:hypothetical protein BHE74_00018636 [Ensete ventricosum]|nr:hypothetical protein BHE74_00018636 [Ensete ventricosum]